MGPEARNKTMREKIFLKKGEEGGKEGDKRGDLVMDYM